MKQVLYISIIFIAICITGCSGETEIMPSIELSYSQSKLVTMDSEGETQTIFFNSDHDWYVEMSGGDGWLDAAPLQGPSGEGRIKVMAQGNMGSDKRSAVLKISCSENSYVTVDIEQEPYVPTFELENDAKSVSAAGGTIEVRVLTDVEYVCEVNADWIEGNGTKAIHKNAHFFTVEPNPYPEQRTAQIYFIYEEKVLTFTVTQRAAGTEEDDWIYEDFKDRSLAMRFTADWCGYCPVMATAFSTASAMMSGGLEVVSIHGDGGLVFEDASRLMSRFHVSGFPTGIIDSRASIPNYTNSSTTAKAAVDVAKETSEHFPACTGIAMKSSQKDGQIKAEVTLYVKHADYYRVTVLLLEDDIIGYQNGASNSYEHDHVARVSLSDIKGDVIDIEKDGTIWTGDYSCTIPEYCNPDNLRLLVYVEKPYGDRKNVTDVPEAQYYSYGDTYVDNCRSAKIGAEAGLE